jgi:hypothetical protein
VKHIFISYRRDDSADVTGRVYDRLREHFGEDTVFIDVDSIPYGVDFRTHIERKVAQCQVLLAVIGRDWLTIQDAGGRRRLLSPTDFVRVEIESALRRNVPVIPLLVHGVGMPAEKSLPTSLQLLRFRNGTPIRPDPDFHRDMDRLIRAIEQHLAAADGLPAELSLEPAQPGGTLVDDSRPEPMPVARVPRPRVSKRFRVRLCP